MKKIALFLSMALVAMMMMVELPANAQTRQQKRMAKKEAKALTKEGFKTMRQPIQQQLEDYYVKASERDDRGAPVYMQSTGTAVAGTFNAARSAAMTSAKVQLASSLQSAVMAETKTALANKQLSAEEAATVDQVMEKTTSQVAQRLGNVIVAKEFYRILPNKNYEVQLTLLYSKQSMTEAMLDEMRQQLQQELKGNSVEKMMEETLFKAINDIMVE